MLTGQPSASLALCFPPCSPVHPVVKWGSPASAQPPAIYNGVSMNSQALRKLFEQVRKKRLSPDDAVERLRHLPFEDLGFAKLDHHRALRQGMPEVIFAPGKNHLGHT